MIHCYRTCEETCRCSRIPEKKISKGEREDDLDTAAGIFRDGDLACSLVDGGGQNGASAKLPIAAAFAAESANECSVQLERLDAIIAGVSDKQQLLIAVDGNVVR